MRFRRQVPIGPYIADFACLSHRLIVEIDGLTHDQPGRYEYDQRRDRWFRSKGWAVILTNDDDVWSHRADVIDYIVLELGKRG